MMSLIFCLGLAQAHAEAFKGDIFALGSDKKELLYRLERKESPSTDGKTKVAGIFTSPDGKEAVLEDSLLKGDRIERYELTQKQLDEHGQLEVKSGRVYFSYTKKGKTKTDDEELTDNLVAGPTLLPYLRAHWANLLKGDDVSVRFAVLDRAETVGFKFFKLEQIKKDGKDLMLVKMKPTSFVIAALVKPLVFTFDMSNQRLVELQGRTIPKVRKGDDWKDLDADIIYHYDAP